jgi:hypothetical protein
MIDLPVLLVRTWTGIETARQAAGETRPASLERISLPGRPESPGRGALT